MWRLLLLYFFLETSFFTNSKQTSTKGINIFEIVHDMLEGNSTGTTKTLFSFGLGKRTTERRSIATTRRIANYKMSEEFRDIKTNFSVPWNIFIATLMQESFDQLKNIQYNINNLYQLGEDEMLTVDNVFNNSDVEFENLLLKKYRKIMKERKINTTKEFRLDFIDTSNKFVRKIVAYNLGLVKGVMDSKTIWLHQTLRDKIVRQQMKNSTNYIQYRICKVLSVCREKNKYSDYVVEWTRHVIALSTDDLKNFFMVVPHVLKQYSSFIKSNVKFRQTLKYIMNSPEVVQRDTLDYLDEVITNRDYIFSYVPQALKQGTWALSQLFDLIDEYYYMDADNVEELQDISELLSMWKHQEINVFYVFEGIVENMKLNMAHWPKDIKDMIESTWYQITVL